MFNILGKKNIYFFYIIKIYVYNKKSNIIKSIVENHNFQILPKNYANVNYF